MGFGREALAELNPRCITVSVSGFGQDAEMRDRTAFDCILQCLTGLAAINGRPGDFPMLTGAYIVDTVAALIATIGALAALQQREQTGVGQLVDVAMLDSALTLLGPVIPVAAATGEEPELAGNADRTSAPADAYRASDGWVYIHAGPDTFFHAHRPGHGPRGDHRARALQGHRLARRQPGRGRRHRRRLGGAADGRAGGGRAGRGRRARLARQLGRAGRQRRRAGRSATGWSRWSARTARRSRR